MTKDVKITRIAGSEHEDSGHVMPDLTGTVNGVKIGSFEYNDVPPPLVTAVMVTGKSMLRKKLALVAIRCFLSQTYANSELLIVNHGHFTLADVIDGYENIREVRAPSDVFVGALRNIGLSEAAGEWIIQWDDDDFYHPDRIQYQMAHRRPGACVLLKWQLRTRLDSADGFAFNCRDPLGSGPTILHPRTDARYQEIFNHSDARFWTDTWGHYWIALENSPVRWPGPSMYTRFFHGDNVSGAVKGMDPSVTSCEAPVTKIQARYLETVRAYYADPERPEGGL